MHRLLRVARVHELIGSLHLPVHRHQLLAGEHVAFSELGVLHGRNREDGRIRTLRQLVDAVDDGNPEGLRHLRGLVPIDVVDPGDLGRTLPRQVDELLEVEPPHVPHPNDAYRRCVAQESVRRPTIGSPRPRAIASVCLRSSTSVRPTSSPIATTPQSAASSTVRGPMTGRSKRRS